MTIEFMTIDNIRNFRGSSYARAWREMMGSPLSDVRSVAGCVTMPPGHARPWCASLRAALWKAAC